MSIDVHRQQVVSCNQPFTAIGNDMGNAIRRLYQGLTRMSPESRAYLTGAGMAFGLYPQSAHDTFARSDSEAIHKDWQAVGADMWSAIGRAEQEKRQRVG
jgi:hypothetical protein